MSGINSKDLRLMAGSGTEVDLLLRHRIRDITQFARISDGGKRLPRLRRLGEPSGLVAAVRALEVADGLVSAAVEADPGLLQHRWLQLQRLCGDDADLRAVSAWRIRKLCGAPLFDVHMVSSTRHSTTRERLGQMLCDLDGRPEAGCAAGAN